MSTELEVITLGRRELVLSPVMDLELAKSRMEQFQQFVAHYLEPSIDGGQDGGDYGPIPGAGKKKVLLKSGADKLCELYGLYDEYEIESQEDFEAKLFYYKIKCILKTRRDDSVVGTGVGSCSTYESKYRWRQQDRTCPKCGNTTIIKGQEQYGGGWICWAKKGGCGAKYPDQAKEIVEQVTGRIENPDIMDTVNTVLKMAKKRAKIDAVIGVTRSSGLFTQDLDDVPMPPAKPPVARTTEDIPIGGNSKAAGQEGNSNTAAAAAIVPIPKVTVSDDVLKEVSTQQKLHEELSLTDIKELQKEAKRILSVKPATLPDGCIGQGEQTNIHRCFRNALREELRPKADLLLNDWLRLQKIVDGNGEPTTKAILKINFYNCRDEAEIYAKTL